MSPLKQRLIDASTILITLALFLLSTGCTKSGPRTYPVKGQVEIAGGNIHPIVGHTVEVALDSDPRVRAAGQIQSDCTFVLESLRGSTVEQGAIAGTYRARIVLADDDLRSRNQAVQVIHPRFLQFEKSGLSFRVPADEIVSLKVTRR